MAKDDLERAIHGVVLLCATNEQLSVLDNRESFEKSKVVDPDELQTQLAALAQATIDFRHALQDVSEILGRSAQGIARQALLEVLMSMEWSGVAHVEHGTWIEDDSSINLRLLLALHNMASICCAAKKPSLQEMREVNWKGGFESCRE
jgi:hypothetical protein